VLREVDVLARAYGWTEAEVLALGERVGRRTSRWPRRARVSDFLSRVAARAVGEAPLRGRGCLRSSRLRRSSTRRREIGVRRRHRPADARLPCERSRRTRRPNEPAARSGTHRIPPHRGPHRVVATSDAAP
jgi:hypothetical protein